jgi:ubiquinone/menaquinone biosynthesis C-methylase UbiE
MRHGDFSQLASIYDTYRPGYSGSVRSAVLSLLPRPVAECSFADVGAGTGKWTRMLAETQPAELVAVEPNLHMRKQGIANSAGYAIEWREGSAEATGLGDASCELVSMASSFHWADFASSTREFDRILKPGGLFVALWNPRFIDNNPLLVAIEEKLLQFKPDLKRVSSGNSGITLTLTEELFASPYFEDVVFIEGRHDAVLSVENYLGAWQSVNDVQVKLGAAAFGEFLGFVADTLRGLETIPVCYKTRAWVARKRGASTEARVRERCSVSIEAGRTVSIPRQSRGLSVAGPSKGHNRNRLRLAATTR